jgi:hypothetical protein
MAHWTIEHEARDDAESVFVPAAELPDAAVGDRVELRAEGTARHGELTAWVDDRERGRFATVRLDPP